ncbi:phosphatase PAP2 family protein [Polaromonas sp.]|uniref:phosphatase PAP2 family protein n=1 Tax=Polaromonas sp. TaxID=1869339 RepID=UPI00286CF2F5|nr:phosphatase PAP2 family protein [Polaromonas sp.]
MAAGLQGVGGFPQNPYTLISSRDATLVPLDEGSYPVVLPPVDDPEAMQRWEPWVRAYVCQAALLEPLSFAKIGAQGAGIWHVETTVAAPPDAPSALSTTPKPLARLDRPAVHAFKEQVKKVLSWADLREERTAEIIAQLDPQFAFWGSVVYLHPSRTPRTLELMNIALLLAVNVEMQFKHALACWRPIEYSAQIQPLITTPGHGALPSGHSTQAYIVAHVLQRLLDLPDSHPVSVQLQRQSARIATNRVVAGVHFPADSMAGRLLGETLGEYFVARCKTGRNWTPRFFDGTVMTGHEDLMPPTQPLDGPNAPDFYKPFGAKESAAASGVLRYMWDKAIKEWEDVRFQ